MENPNGYTHESATTVERKTITLRENGHEVQSEVRIQPNTRKAIK